MSSTILVAVRKPVTIVALRDLDLMAATAIAGTVTIAPDTGARSVTGGVIAMGGTVQTARFRVTATPSTLVLITRNALPVLTRASGGATMPVTLLTMNGSSNPVNTPAGRTFDVDVGGILSVGIN